MTLMQLARRVDKLECEIRALRRQIKTMTGVPLTADDFFGMFHGDEDFKKAMELGAAYRRSLHPDYRRRKARKRRPAPANDWNANVGIFANDPLFEKAVRYGKGYRESLRPKAAKRRTRRK
jgi:hypothetical protein